MEIDYAILADGVSQRDDGKLDIYGAAWDTIFASSVPARHNRLTLATRIFISREDSEFGHDLAVVVQSAGGDELARAEAKVDPAPFDDRNALPAGRQFGINVVLNFENLLFPAFGDYKLTVSSDGVELSTVPLRVEQLPDPKSKVSLPDF